MPDSPQNAPPKVFISYAWKNQAVAKQLQRDLQRDGVKVFVDYQQMLPGQSLPKRISDALKWCNTLVLLCSAESDQSYWVTLEWENAIALRKQIIPCLLDHTELPAVLTRTLFLDFSNYESGYAELCRTLRIEAPKAQPQYNEASKAHEKADRESTPASVKIWQPAKYALIILAAIVAIYFLQNLLKTSAMPEKQLENASKTGSIDIADSVAPSPIRQTPVNVNEAIEKTTRKAPSKSTRTLPPIPLRSTPKDNLSRDEVRIMVVKNDFFIADYDWNKNFSNPQGEGINNDFELQHGGSVVYDKTTGLMWQQSGSENYMTYPDAEKYVRNLRLADYSDWRLPTLEEAMSLMEPKEYSDLYLDPKFDRKQSWIWTADKRTAGVAWVVAFSGGDCANGTLGYDLYVRAVR